MVFSHLHHVFCDLFSLGLMAFQNGKLCLHCYSYCLWLQEKVTVT